MNFLILFFLFFIFRGMDYGLRANFFMGRPRGEGSLSLGLMKGHANGKLKPQGKTTRAESAQAVLYLLNQQNK